MRSPFFISPLFSTHSRLSSLDPFPRFRREVSASLSPFPYVQKPPPPCAIFRVYLLIQFHSSRFSSILDPLPPLHGQRPRSSLHTVSVTMYSGSLSLLPSPRTHHTFASLRFLTFWLSLWRTPFSYFSMLSHSWNRNFISFRLVVEFSHFCGLLVLYNCHRRVPRPRKAEQMRMFLNFAQVTPPPLGGSRHHAALTQGPAGSPPPSPSHQPVDGRASHFESFHRTLSLFLSLRFSLRRRRRHRRSSFYSFVVVIAVVGRTVYYWSINPYVVLWVVESFEVGERPSVSMLALLSCGLSFVPVTSFRWVYLDGCGSVLGLQDVPL